MIDGSEPIHCKRLELASLYPQVLETLISGDIVLAQELLNCQIPGDYPFEQMPLVRRLRQIRGDVAQQPWVLPAVVDRNSRMMIGHIGFHSPP